MGLSLALSTLVYLLMAGGLAAAIATARAVVIKKERDVEIHFAVAPEQPKPEQPKPKPKVKKEAPKPVKKEGVDRGLQAPTEIPDQINSEAAGGALSEADRIEIDQMIGDGGKKRGPRQRRVKPTRPKYLGGCRAPEVPDSLRVSAETVRVQVRIVVGPDGMPTDATILKPHPSIPDEEVLKCALAHRFEPATVFGHAIATSFIRGFTFKPSNI